MLSASSSESVSTAQRAVVAAAAVAATLALDIYNTVSIEELSSQADQQQVQIDHILVAVNRLTEAVEENVK